ncbi:D-alanyl-D-alanine carboxypeptidase family protein [Alloscardovia theropitheci]|uniref:D-alanyl-D-alanine carboxypeptidase family protein n=1 Tax=Alloscardovia theropitheci TaxID=2496842 RepID=A0A4V2MU14_9BIFI|nr:M15 family metallopeptidase [Alloscardovia theropitheci]TCD54569.1 D-alanyl-D-alanine carboxypeptidase family protein [Alloscardovia theropitheci]
MVVVLGVLLLCWGTGLLHFIHVDSSHHTHSSQQTHVLSDRSKEAQTRQSSRGKFQKQKNLKKQTIAQKFGITSDDWRLVLVNRTHTRPEMNPALAQIDSRCAVDSRIASDLEQFLAHAQRIDRNVHYISCYRSVEYQHEVFERYVNDEMSAHPDWSREQAETQVKTYSQPAGASEHQTGLAVDLSSQEELNAQNPDLARKIQEIAPQYGFILRFPQGGEKSTGVGYEDWHYRYVGPDIARYITDRGWTLEEFIKHIDDVA